MSGKPLIEGFGLWSRCTAFWEVRATPSWCISVKLCANKHLGDVRGHTSAHTWESRDRHSYNTSKHSSHSKQFQEPPLWVSPVRRLWVWWWNSLELTQKAGGPMPSGLKTVLHRKTAGKRRFTSNIRDKDWQKTCTQAQSSEEHGEQGSVITPQSLSQQCVCVTYLQSILSFTEAWNAALHFYYHFAIKYELNINLILVHLIC